MSGATAVHDPRLFIFMLRNLKKVNPPVKCRMAAAMSATSLAFCRLPTFMQRFSVLPVIMFA